MIADLEYRKHKSRRLSTAAEAVKKRADVVVVVYQLTPSVLGGLRSNLMLLRYFRRTAALVITNSIDEFANMLTQYSVPFVTIPSSINLQQFRSSTFLARILRIVQIISLQWRLTCRLREIGARILHVDYEAWWLLSLIPRMLGYKLVQYIRNEPKSGLRLWTVLLASNRNIFISQTLREHILIRASPLIRKFISQKSTVIRNSIDLDAVANYCQQMTRSGARRRLGVEGDEVVCIGLIGTLCMRKGQLDFLEKTAPLIFKRLDNCCLFLIGDSTPQEWRQRCEKVVSASGWRNRVRFVDFCDNIYEWYLALDIIAHNSQAEGIARVILEAQAFERPVVAKNIIGMSEAMKDRKSGFIANTPEEFADAIVILGTDKKLRTEMGRAGAKYVNDNYHPALSAAQLEELYANV